MQFRIPRIVALVLLAAALPVTAALAQSAPQPPAAAPGQNQAQRPRLSPEARARLLDGRMAMIKETLKLNDAQLKLWAPVEQQIRGNATERQKRFAERREHGATRPSLAERLNQASQRMTQRADRMKAFNDVFQPFYASLGDEQKALSRIVMREARGGRGPHRHWAQRERMPAPQQQ